MLREVEDVAQKEDHVFRRWFVDDDLELIVWHDAEKREITGFQLCYDLQRNEHAFTWEKPGLLTHNKIDDRRATMGHPATPVLVADGEFPYTRIIRKFRERSAQVEKTIVDLVIEKLSEYAGPKS
ncbi:MAG: hypothetical protein JW807_11795 [Spirochaetes bacterium]|nr:hypothetical protein [Spirochaetota bacterium]